MSSTSRLMLLALVTALSVRSLQSPEGLFRARSAQWLTSPSVMDDPTTEPTSQRSDTDSASIKHRRQELLPTTRATHDTIVATTFDASITTGLTEDASPSTTASDEGISFAPRDTEAAAHGNGTDETAVWKYNEEAVIQAVLFLFGVVFFLPMCIVGFCLVINACARCRTMQDDDHRQRRPLL